MVSIVKVDSSNDFKMAKVYISVLEGKEARDEVTEALNGAKGYLRRELGKRLKDLSYAANQFCIGRYFGIRYKNERADFGVE